MAALPPTMQAWQYEAYGEKTVKAVTELPVPVPNKDEILLKVDATSLNAGDCKLQTGMAKFFVPLKLPITPGMDIAGKVVGLGEEVSGFAVGDAVFANTLPQLSGGLAEYAVVKAATTVKVPSQVTCTDAAGLPVAAVTALASLRKAGITNFDGSFRGRILVLNATGGVGTFVVQMAKLAGAWVVATAGSRNLELVKKSLGADQVYDYQSEEGRTLSFVHENEFDVIVYGASVSNVSKIMQALKPGGTMTVIAGDVSTLWRGALLSISPFTKKVVHVLVWNKDRKDLELLAQWVAEGKLKVVVDSIVPFAEAPIAWKKVLDGHAVGKVIITVP